MVESAEWKVLADEGKAAEDRDTEGDGDVQDAERKRRMLSTSRTKTHRKYIQDVVTFLAQEAAAAEEEVKFEHREVGSDHQVRVSLGGDSVEALRKTLKSAKEGAAMQMLIMIGPYLEESVWKASSEAVSDCVSVEYRPSWLPPVYDARHLSLGPSSSQPPFYEVEVQLGPITAVSVSENLSSSLETLTKHTSNFLSTRDLPGLLREPQDESLKEMEVFSHLNQPYVQTTGLLEVRMKSSNSGAVLPPVDVFVMQQHLPDGKFPPQYGGKDVYGCTKVFWCHLTQQEIVGVDNLLAHVHSRAYWRRLGKIFVNGHLRETFNPGGEVSLPGTAGEETAEERQVRLSCTPRLCQSCLDRSKRKVAEYWNKNNYEYFCADCTENKSDPKIEKLPPPTVIHPMKDKEAGREVSKDSLKYLISVYRCVDQLSSGPPSLLTMNLEPVAGAPYKPPNHNGGGFGGLYSEGARGGFKSGWEDPFAPKMGWDDPTQPQFGFGRGGGGYQGYPRGGHMGYGGFGPMRGFGGFGGHMGNRMRWNSPGGNQGHFAPAPSDPGAVGLKRKITAEKKLEKYSGGEVIMPESEEDVQEAYTGKVGKTGFSEKNKKETARYAALPPPGHSQWNKISGNENFKIDNSMANLKPVGANFKANKTGVRVCIPWKRGMCKLGDRCNYNHGDPQQTKLQSLVDANISPLERDLSGYRIAADNKPQTDGLTGAGAAGGTGASLHPANSREKGKTPSPFSAFVKLFVFVEESVNEDWFSQGTSEVKMRSADKDAILKSIQTAKFKMEGMETDFTQVKKKSKWD